jgi:cyanoexosortase B-associated protein
MISFLKSFNQRHISQIAALLLLIVILVIGAVPGYLKGRWVWQEPPPVTNLKELKQIRQTGLTLPGWQIIEQREQEIGGSKWSYQVSEKLEDKSKILLFLLPQNGPRTQPQVEWTELNSFWQWNVAQDSSAEFTVKQPPASGSNSETKVKANFFRASITQQTFAVLQWYAWPNGGDPSPLSWFLADQLAQLSKQRAPWVAVSILIPMEPFGQVEKMRAKALSVGQTVQTALITGPL